MHSKSFDINICKGCESLYSDSEIPNSLNCLMAPECGGRQCPCIECLVKMRCRIDDCDEFQNYRRSLHIGYFHVKKE